MYAKRALLSVVCLLVAMGCDQLRGQVISRPSRCESIPVAGKQVSFRIDGVEKLRWHYGDDYVRPFFYPFNGPSGASLTRMGHPGAPDHDHHQSVWFAHNKIQGENFWGNGHRTLVRQKMWYAYQDGDHEAVMAVLIGWYGANGNEIMEQEMVAALIAMPNDEHALEIQFTLRPPAEGNAVELEKTNFGFLAVRVAKSISAHFGNGRLTNSDGHETEKNTFGKAARWMDYSGPVAVGLGKERRHVAEGITCFDHPGNPTYPTRWHVRDDGWMGASVCMEDGFSITAAQPLTLRYLLHAHSGAYEASRAEAVHAEFSGRKGFVVIKCNRNHRHYEVVRREPQ